MDFRYRSSLARVKPVNLYGKWFCVCPWCATCNSYGYCAGLSKQLSVAYKSMGQILQDERIAPLVRNLGRIAFRLGQASNNVDAESVMQTFTNFLLALATHSPKPAGSDRFFLSTGTRKPNERDRHVPSLGAFIRVIHRSTQFTSTHRLWSKDAGTRMPRNWKACVLPDSRRKGRQLWMESTPPPAQCVRHLKVEQNFRRAIQCCKSINELHCFTAVPRMAIQYPISEILIPHFTFELEMHRNPSTEHSTHGSLLKK